jgi:hypothetical protein
VTLPFFDGLLGTSVLLAFRFCELWEIFSSSANCALAVGLGTRFERYESIVGTKIDGWIDKIVDVDVSLRVSRVSAEKIFYMFHFQ